MAYLSPAAQGLCAIITLAPAVARHVAPLEHAEVTGEAGGQEVSQLVTLAWPRAGWVILLTPRLQVEEMLVKTSLGYWPVPPVVGAQPRLEVALVVGGELHLDFDDAVHGEVGAELAKAKLSAHLIVPGLGHVIGVPTQAAHPFILVPLPPKPPTIGLVIIHIDGSAMAVSPHCRPPRRLSQTPM